jgi:hypothetical protein
VNVNVNVNANANANANGTTQAGASALEEVASGLWIRRTPFRFLGLLEIGTKMTVLRFEGEGEGKGEGGGLVVHSPVPITPEVKSAIDALGRVRFIIAPSLYHHVSVGSAVEAWPDAKLLAPAGLRKKRRDLKIDEDLESGAPSSLSGAIDFFPIRGSLLGETVFHHRESKTLVSADLFENFSPPVDHMLTRAYLKIGGIYGKPGWHRLFHMFYRDKKAAKACIEPLLDLDLERIVVAHGDLVTSRPRETLQEALHFLLR